MLRFQKKRFQILMLLFLSAIISNSGLAASIESKTVRSAIKKIKQGVDNEEIEFMNGFKEKEIFYISSEQSIKYDPRLPYGENQFEYIDKKINLDISSMESLINGFGNYSTDVTISDDYILFSDSVLTTNSKFLLNKTVQSFDTELNYQESLELLKEEGGWDKLDAKDEISQWLENDVTNEYKYTAKGTISLRDLLFDILSFNKEQGIIEKDFIQIMPTDEDLDGALYWSIIN